jgi:hypothetical protein
VHARSNPWRQAGGVLRELGPSKLRLTGEQLDIVSAVEGLRGRQVMR